MSHEQSIAELDAFILEQHKLYMLLFNLVLRHDDRLRLDVAEAIRKILVTPIEDAALSPVLRPQLQSLRDSLLASPQPEMVSAFSQPPIRPVQ